MPKSIGWSVVVLLAIVAGVLIYGQFEPRPVKFETPYQAVVLAGGQVYYGKLEGVGTRFPVLRNIYYVRSVETNAATHETKNVLIRRGNEWHGPDRMYLNPGSVLLIEPVSPDSQVAKLIAEQEKK